MFTVIQENMFRRHMPAYNTSFVLAHFNKNKANQLIKNPQSKNFFCNKVLNIK